jgi:hypothetical protein
MSSWSLSHNSKYESHRQQGEQKNRGLLSREEKRRDVPMWEGVSDRLSQRSEHGLILWFKSPTGVNQWIDACQVEGKLHCPNTIGLFKSPTMYTFLSISDWFWDLSGVVHGLQQFQGAFCGFKSCLFTPGPMVHSIASSFPDLPSKPLPPSFQSRYDL